MLTPSWEINGEHCEMVFQPVFDAQKELKGYVGALINLETLAHGVFVHDAMNDGLTSVTVSQTERGGKHLIVEASYPAEAEFDAKVLDSRMNGNFRSSCRENVTGSRSVRRIGSWRCIRPGRSG